MENCLTGGVPIVTVGTSMSASKVGLRPIWDDDIGAVAEFLDANMHGHISASAWQQALSMPWTFDRPNHGYMLIDNDTIVGAYVAFYSERNIHGRSERICNLASWCVLPGYRFHSLRLAKALLDQPGYTFTDLSPGEGVAALNQRLGFQSLDTSVAQIRTFPWPALPGRVKIVSSRDEIEAMLNGKDLEIYRDHVTAAACHQLVLSSGDETCHVIFRKARPGRIRKVPHVTILHVSNPELFVRATRPLARHLLVRYGALAIRAELRVVKHQPPHSSIVHVPHLRRMYKSSSMRPDEVDYLYSELTCVFW